MVILEEATVEIEYDMRYFPRIDRCRELTKESHYEGNSFLFRDCRA